MKIGFSSLVCPGWDMERIVRAAAEFGYDGVELRGVRGALHLPLVPELAGHPQVMRELFCANKVELVCLASSVTLDSKSKREVARQKAILVEFVELAGELGCPYVRIFVGEIQRWDNPRRALARVASALASIVPQLARSNVTLLVENGGDFPGSADLWFLVDAVSHPCVLACWNQCYALTIRERPTVSIPRLGQCMGMVHLCDATVDEFGVLQEYKRLGAGHAETAKQIELLRGVAYDRYLVFEWPKLWVNELAEPEDVLPATAQYLRERIEAKQSVLSAYKGDKNAPKMAPRKLAPSP